MLDKIPVCITVQNSLLLNIDHIHKWRLINYSFAFKRIFALIKVRLVRIISTKTKE